MNLKEITVEALKELGKSIKGITLFEFKDVAVYDITFVTFTFESKHIQGVYSYSLSNSDRVVHSITSFSK